jgi:DhnA family fructose-bisphosphate aldolase class Ia
MTKSDYLNSFFQEDGRTVILPLDHGTAIPVPDMAPPGELIESVRDWVDGFVVNLGLARHCREQLSGKGVCLRTDVYKPALPGNPDPGPARIFTAEDAASAGAQAVMNMFYLHHPEEAANARECTALISECEEFGLPVIIESLPIGIGRPDDYTIENVAYAARFAAELGADVVKTVFPTGATVDDFKKIVDATMVPVVVLGGAAMGDDEALLTMVKNAIDGGASGIAVGRNVWQHPHPPTVAAALREIVHENASVDSALKLMG